MPGGINGIDLGGRLLKEMPELKVIYVSGYSAEIAGKDFPLEEGVDFLTKPFEARKLAQTVRNSWIRIDPDWAAEGKMNNGSNRGQTPFSTTLPRPPPIEADFHARQIPCSNSNHALVGGTFCPSIHPAGKGDVRHPIAGGKPMADWKKGLQTRGAWRVSRKRTNGSWQ